MKPFYDWDGITIYCGDCLEVMPQLEGTFDVVIADLPYGTTACSWDTVIPFEPLWEQYKRLTTGAVVLFGSQPFTSALVMSNIKWFKWENVWEKTQAVGHLTANVKPMSLHENILLFGNGRVTFNPQFSQKPAENIRPSTGRTQTGTVYNKHGLGDHRTVSLDTSYPKSIIRVANVNRSERVGHPTQKPVALLAYLIRTYTNPGEIILDNTMGSGTTLVAARNEGRRAVGIEISEDYCQIAVERLRQRSMFQVIEMPEQTPPHQTEMPL